VVAGRESISILIGLAGYLNDGFHAKSTRIDYIEAQFAAIALAKERQGAKEENGYGSMHEESAFCGLAVIQAKVDRPCVPDGHLRRGSSALPLELKIPFPGFLFSLFSVSPGEIEDLREKS
jgi:hypothetical protein